MSDVYDIWLYPLQDWCKMVNEISDFMSAGQMGNLIICPVSVFMVGGQRCYPGGSSAGSIFRP